MNDAELLRQFASGSQEAFTQLVHAHPGWIYAAALRRTNDRHLAEDVTQATFIVLCREGKKLRPGRPLGPWLFRVMSYAASTTLRTQSRRRHHERTAATMQQSNQHGEADQWQLMSGEVDELLMRLAEKDREAIVLRFYEGKSFVEMAAGLGIGEDAARKRIERALERLRDRFHGRGVKVTSAGLATALAAHASPAPTAAAISAAAAASGGASIGATQLAMHATQALALTKLKLVAGAILIALFAVAVPVILYSSGHSSAPSGVAPQPNIAAGTTIKVGWMVSEWTATEHPYGKPGTFDSVTAIRGSFIDPQIELYAIIEPGTKDSDLIRTTLAQNFQPGRVIDGSDAGALSKLDVIVCSRDWNMRPAVMAAIVKAVENGTGLLRHVSTGIFGNEGDNEGLARINCMDDPTIFWTREPIDCVVVSDHELLAGLRKSLPEGRMKIANVNGCIGYLRGEPLIVAEAGMESATARSPKPSRRPRRRRWPPPPRRRKSGFSARCSSAKSARGGSWRASGIRFQGRSATPRAGGSTSDAFSGSRIGL